MGAGNALLVLHNWAHLPANARFVLLKIALIILDEDPKPRWWGGEEPLLKALGREDPPPDDMSEEADRVRHANDVALRRSLADLVKAGALSYAVRPVKGRRAEYLAHWMPQGEPAAYAGSPCGIRRESLQIPQGEPVPKEDLGGERNRRGIRSPEVTTSPAAEDPYAAAHEILAQLPDLGAALLASVADGPLRERVIAAAALHLAAS